MFKFLAGFAVGAMLGRPVLDVMEKHYGDLILPRIRNFTYNLAEQVIMKQENYK